MFYIEYTYKKKGGQEYNSKYPNTEIDTNKNIFLLKGGNDLGKTTTMQIIAYALYGLNSSDLSETIKNRIIKKFFNGDLEKFEFNIRFGDKDNKEIFNSKCNNINDCINVENDKIKYKNPPLSKNGKYISENEFQDGYKLIFDIPDEVMNKFQDALISIKDEINYLKEKTNNYKNELQIVYEKYTNFYNIDKKLKENNDNLKKLMDLEEFYDNKIKELKDKFEEYHKLYIVWEYNRLDSQIKNLFNRREKIEEMINKYEKSKSKNNKSYTDLNLEFINFKTNINDLLHYFENDESNDEIINFKNICKIFVDKNDIFECNETNFKEFEHALNTLENLLQNKIKQISPNISLELELLKKLREILSNYISLNPEIPGTNGKQLTQFLKDIDEKINLLEFKNPEIKNKNKLENALTILNKLKQKNEKIIKLLRKKGNEENNNSEITLSDLEKEKDEIDKTLDPLLKDIEKIEDEYNNLTDKEKNIDYDIFNMGVYKTLEDDLKKTKEEHDKILNNIKTIDKLIDELNQDYRTIMTELPNLSELEIKHQIELCSDLIDKFDKWSDNLKKVIKKEYVYKEKIDNETSNFYNALGKYLASSLQSIAYENGEFKIQQIDIINESFILENGKVVRFVDIGTGHTALNSLKAKIKQDYGGKKKILLLDDIGLMDKNSIDILMNEIKNEVRSGNVILAILSIADRTLEHVEVEGIDDSEVKI